MKTYLGVKLVQAEPMSEGKFIEERKGDVHSKITLLHNTPVSADLYANDGYKVKYKDGYISWCPKEAFEEANKEIPEGSSLYELLLFGMLHYIDKEQLEKLKGEIQNRLS